MANSLHGETLLFLCFAEPANAAYALSHLPIGRNDSV